MRATPIVRSVVEHLGVWRLFKVTYDFDSFAACEPDPSGKGYWLTPAWKIVEVTYAGLPFPIRWYRWLDRVVWGEG